MRIQEEISPIELIHTPLCETVLDLGQNMAGIFRLSVNAPKRAPVRLQFGEILQKGNFYRDNLRSAKAEYLYISDGNPRVIQPHFTFYGYRYVKVEGVADLKKEDFTALVLYSELPKTGTLTTGHDLVNRLIQNTEWGQKGNFIDVPTDCPQRDERMGGQGTLRFSARLPAFCATAMHFIKNIFMI
jgi:alpha-L-rhamnosidase